MDKDKTNAPKENTDNAGKRIIKKKLLRVTEMSPDDPFYNRGFIVGIRRLKPLSKKQKQNKDK